MFAALILCDVWSNGAHTRVTKFISDEYEMKVMTTSLCSVDSIWVKSSR